MPISIITRAKKTSEVKNLIYNLNSNLEVEKEIIAVCIINDCNIENAKVILENSKMLEAKITGIKNAKFDKILFLDSDQIPQKGLLEELDKRNEDMIIIPEKSYNNNLIGKLLDYQRDYMFKYSKLNPSPLISVIPRFYKKELMLQAIKNINDFELKNIVQYEDSLLYYEIYKLSKNIGFSNYYIYNIDPPLNVFLKKSFNYGLMFGHSLKLYDLKEEHKNLFKKLNSNIIIFNKELGINPGIIIKIIKGIPYLFGYLRSILY